MDEVALTVQERREMSKGTMKAFRAAGQIPAVIYGHGEAVHILVQEKEFHRAMHTESGINALINLKINGEEQRAMVKEVQRDNLKDIILHVDFLRIGLDDTIEVGVPVHVVGQAAGVLEQGGVLDQPVREIRLRCFPTDIPHDIKVDVSGLEIGQGIALKQLPLPDAVEVIHPEVETIVVHVVAATQEDAPAVEAVPAAEGTEPEVISKGKQDEEQSAEGKKAPPVEGKK